jgi:hypothetical protein
MCRPCLTTAHVYKDDVMLALAVRSQWPQLTNGVEVGWPAGKTDDIWHNHDDNPAHSGFRRQTHLAERSETKETVCNLASNFVLPWRQTDRCSCTCRSCTLGLTHSSLPHCPVSIESKFFAQSSTKPKNIYKKRKKVINRAITDPFTSDRTHSTIGQRSCHHSHAFSCQNLPNYNYE